MKFQGSVVTLCLLLVMHAPIGEANNRKEITKRSAERENIALNKETFSSSVSWGGVSSRAVDGNRDGIYNNDHCMHTGTNGRHWFLVNLEAVYDIDTIDIWSRTDWTVYGKMRNFSVYIGQKYTPCKEYLFDNYELCEKFGDEIQPRQKSIKCNMRGQYILVVKGHETSRGDTLIICELEVTGKKVFNVTPFKKPNMPQLDDLPIPSERLAAHKTITQNIRSLKFHWNTVRIHVLKDTVEPILWFPEKQMIFMAGVQLGRGRIIVISGYSVWLDNMQSQPDSAISRGVKKWIVGNENAPFIYIGSQSRLSDSKAGDILYVKHWQPESVSRLKEAVQLVREGKIGLILPLMDEKLQNYDFLMKEIGMYISSHRQNQPYLWTHQINVANMKNNPMFPIKTLLSSFSGFIKFSDQITVASKEVPEDRLRDIGFVKDFFKVWLQIFGEVAEWKIPCESRQITSEEDKTIVTAYNNYFLSSDLLIDSNIKAPGVDQYPGDVQSPKLVTKKLIIIASVKNEYHSTGLYLPAGHTMTVTIHSGSADKWFIQIGCWTDNISRRPGWTRYPLIHSKHHLPTNKIFSAFGGNVLIKNTNLQTGLLELTLSGVVEAPYFNLRDPQSISNWMSRRNADAPWGEVVGDALTFCILSKTFRHWDTAYIKEFTDGTYDKIVKSNHHLLGHDWRKHRREFIVFDRQISVGSGHSGYPIMGMLDWHNSLNLEKNKKGGNWGVSYVLGRNFRDEKFSFKGAGAVINNIFTLWNNHYIWHLPVFGNNQGRLNIKDIKHYLINQKADHQYWSKNPFVALALFPQMTTSFGWSLLKNVFRTYWDNSRQQPRTDEEKMDEWMKRASEAAKSNLAPLFDFWGFPLSDNARKSVEKFPCFLPDDFITKAVPERVDFILAKYLNRCRRNSSKVPDIYGDGDFKPLKTNDVIFY